MGPKTRPGLTRKIFGIVILVGCYLSVMGQNCEVDFPGTAARNFSSICGGASTSNLTLGKNTYLGNGDTFTFNLPTITITGNVDVNVQGSGKIIIPAGVTVNVEGNFQLNRQNPGCTSSNPCAFEIEVNGVLNLSHNFQSNLLNVIWLGSGTVTVEDNFKNSNNGCMSCSSGGCPNFNVNASKCSDDGSGCAGGNFCTRINTCASDTSSPVITSCPTNITVNANASCQAVVNWGPPTFTDNCTGGTLTSTKSPGDIFNAGITTVTYTASDVSGNNATCSFTVSVIDNTLPVFTSCPSNITLPADASCSAKANWNPPNVADNCAVTITSSHAPGDVFPIGITTVTYSATNTPGQASSCSFTIEVKDLTPPIFTGTGDVIATAGSSCTTAVNFPAPVVRDCGAFTMTSSHQPGDEFPIGSTQATFRATDNSGNSAAYKFNVVVEDKSAPVFRDCSDDIIVLATPTCNAVANWDVPKVEDNCTVSSVESSHNPGDTFPSGKTVVKYTATDQAGNISICQFNVIVKNERVPLFADCPTDIRLEGIVGGTARAEWVPPTVSTPCGEVTLTSSHNSGDFFEVGITKVEYTATDNAGSTAVCYFNVTVSPMEIDIAKVITPDGNGVNDEWILKNIENFKSNKVSVVDRWGGLIFEGSGYDNQHVVWRGTNRSGGQAPTGTYFYTISIAHGSEKVERTGFVELIR